ncbi:MAG: hypothetical protein OSA89_16750, partial [Mariniblastus sp.]|nr:hypothetical protein [Mariniblastus sp.]
MDKYWLADAWSSNATQISDAASYPNGTPFKTPKYDHFYIACYDGDEVPPYVDVVILIDESASSTNQRQWRTSS